MIKWTRASRLSIKISLAEYLSDGAGVLDGDVEAARPLEDVPVLLARLPAKEREFLLTTYWSESTISSR